MTTRYDVLVVGDYCLDLIFTDLPKFPEMGIEVEAGRFEMTPGGAYNSAAALHRLGLKVGWASDFGSDEFSRFVLDRAHRDGLDDSLFVIHDRPLRYVTASLSFPQDRAFVGYYDPQPKIPAAMEALSRISARVLYLPGLYAGPLLDAGLRIVRARGMRLVMDGNSAEAVTLEAPAVRQAISAVDLLLANSLEARRITGERDLETAIRRLTEYAPCVVVKDGAAGSYGCARAAIVHAPALPLTPLDTTGAGDCYNAGFVCAWLEGAPLETCLRWGNVVGGLSTLGVGGTGRVVTRAEVERMLAE